MATRITEKGWIKLYRKLLDSAVWEGPEPFDTRSAWIDILLMCNHDDREVILRTKRAIIIHPGQCLTSIRKLAERWKWSKDKVRRYLSLLCDMGMVKISDPDPNFGTQVGTTITVVNYGLYQSTRDSERVTDRYTDRYTDKDADGTLTRPEQEHKNIKNIRTEEYARARAGASPFSSGGAIVYDPRVSGGSDGGPMARVYED